MPRLRWQAIGLVEVAPHVPLSVQLAEFVLRVAEGTHYVGHFIDDGSDLVEGLPLEQKLSDNALFSCQMRYQEEFFLFLLEPLQRRLLLVPQLNSQLSFLLLGQRVVWVVRIIELRLRLVHALESRLAVGLPIQTSLAAILTVAVDEREELGHLAEVRIVVLVIDDGALLDTSSAVPANIDFCCFLVHRRLLVALLLLVALSSLIILFRDAPIVLNNQRELIKQFIGRVHVLLN